jgi:hypothetical protein
MTREDIIRMAQEAGFRFPANYDVREPIRRLEHFAALIEQEMLTNQKIWHYQEGVEDEREECARLVEQAGIDGYGTLAAAAMIRARRQA